ncbi:MAG: T9SS type A sorting domain-containing protein [Crocinitomicaceae bacterium]|nr:T9SS type A sorting domain-containing protein [Crocinitomicaceae bacterium]
MYEFIEINNDLYFNADYDAAGNELWKFDKTLGVQKIENSVEVKLYPNPAKNLINIITDKEVSMTLMNIHGQVLNTYSSVFSHQIDLSKLSQGIYLIRVPGNQQIHRFVKE